MTHYSGADGETAGAGRRPLRQKPLDLRMDGKVVWITGASRGIGCAMAHAFAVAGAKVLLSARSQEQLEAVAGEVSAAGAEVELVAGSVEDPRSADQAIERLTDRWGRLDALINNAGISPSFKPATAVDPAETRSVLETNLLGPMQCAQKAFPMLEGCGGSIVNVSSIHGTRAGERLLSYSVSKGGLEMLPRSLALEWASAGVRVNSLAPAYLATDMTTDLLAYPRWGKTLLDQIPMGRFGTPAEVVAGALFLASPLSSYVTGTTLFIDGGWAAK